jgi:Holliday junction resolvasome RuvABC endonuclease subunit
MTTVCGIDTSLTATGLARITWASQAVAVDTHRTGITGVTNMDYPGKHQAVTDLAGRILDWVLPAALVVIEEPVSDPRSTSTWERAYLWWAVVGRLLDREVPLMVVAPAAAKKWATGSGRADKDDMVSAMARMWPQVERVKNDTADALALAGIGLQLLDGPVPGGVTAYRREVVGRLTVMGAGPA